MQTWTCSHGHTYTSPIRVKAVSCGHCNHDSSTKSNQNLMTLSKGQKG